MGKYTIDEGKISQLNDYFINNAVESARKHGFYQGIAIAWLVGAGFEFSIPAHGFIAGFGIFMALVSVIQAGRYKRNSSSGPQL